MAPAWLESNCKVCAHKHALISWLAAYRACREISCRCEDTLLENGSDKNRRPARLVHDPPKSLSIRSDQDVPVPKSLPSHAGLAAHDTARFSILTVSVSSRLANARSL